ncbi:MAG: hypothetical protein J6T10_12460 [Methanobrevibacter sp.]|nr:hypothetical protein [Methanobrevibacter sp.]
MFSGAKGTLIPADASDEQKENFKTFVQTVVYALASSKSADDSISDKQIARDTLNEKREQLETLLNGINDDVKQVLDLLIDGLSDENDAFAVYKVDPNPDKRTSFIQFVFGNENKAYVIPMGNIRLAGQPSIYNDITFNQSIPLSLISSKGRVHLPLSRFSKKFHLNTHGGVFVPITPESDFSDEMSDAAHLFYNSKGRFYNM